MNRHLCASRVENDWGKSPIVVVWFHVSPLIFQWHHFFQLVHYPFFSRIAWHWGNSQLNSHPDQQKIHSLWVSHGWHNELDSLDNTSWWRKETKEIYCIEFKPPSPKHASHSLVQYSKPRPVYCILGAAQVQFMSDGFQGSVIIKLFLLLTLDALGPLFSISMLRKKHKFWGGSLSLGISMDSNEMMAHSWR